MEREPDISALLRIVASNRGGRGVSLLSRASHWERALALCVGAEKALIVTGFFIPSARAPETDGPPGAVILGRALARLGKDAALATDSRNFSVLSACSRSVEGPPVLRMDDADPFALDGLDLLVFLERPGRALDGRYYNMRGLDVTPDIAPLDDLAPAAIERGISVLGIGDGGNEAGMGFAREELTELLPRYAPFLSCVPSTVCLAADVSNWGGYALAALLSACAGQWVGVTEEEETRMLRAVFERGAVDGVFGRPGLSVDGFSLPRLAQVTARIEDWYQLERNTA